MALAVFLSQTISLLLELALFRFISIEHFHQFASVTVGIVLAGYGFSGFLVYFLGRNNSRYYRPGPYIRALPLTITASIVALFLVKVEPSHLLISPEKAFFLFFLFLLLSSPFAVSGAIVGSAFTSLPMSKFRVYALSMVGAGSGALLWFFLSRVMPLKAILSALIVSSTLMIFLVPGDKKSGLPGIPLLCLLSFAGILCVLFIPQPLSDYKALSQFQKLEGRKFLEKSFDVDGEYRAGISDHFHALPGLSPDYKGPVPGQVFAFLDGNISGWSFLPSPSRHLDLLDHMPEMALFLHEGREALIAGYDSGVFQAMASHRGYERVTVAEGRKGFLSLMSKVGSFDDDKSIIVTASPNLFIRKTEVEFDLIFIPEAGSLSYAMVYGKPLSEDYLLTEEIVGHALRRLKKGGILAISGWSKNPLREEGKILNLFRKVLGSVPPDRFVEKVIVVYGYSRFVIMLSKDSFNTKFIGELKAFLGKTGFPAIIEGVSLRGDFEDEAYEKSILSFLEGEGNPGERSPFFLGSPSFDSPYFYRFFKLGGVTRIYEKLGRNALVFFESGYMMLLLSLVVVATTGFFTILLPSLGVLIAFSRERTATLKLLALGVLCGFGYTTVEMIFVGRAPFFFDSYTEGFLIVLAIFLASSGIGAFFGERFMVGRYGRFVIVSVGMILILSGVVIFPFFSGKLTSVGIAFERIIFVAICMAVSFLLGFYLPPVLSEMEEKSGKEGLVSLWGINNFSSLLGSLITPLVTVGYGFFAAFAGASALYLLFAFLFLVGRR